MEHPENDQKYKGLIVNKGVAQPPSVNPYIKKRTRGGHRTVSEYVDGILAGNRVILSQAVTLVESARPDHQQKAQAIIEKCLPYSGNSIRIGITGVPGAGKSTSIDTFGMHLLKKGHKLAVLAIDPSSERSKGSILGDKTRMERLSVEQNAFIRPSPSAGSLGGVARKTRETIILCEAAGFDYLFIETVGVGQSEIAVHSMVDFFMLIQLAGTGDELQGIKRGIMEMADGIVINKADGDNIDKAQMAQRQLRNALHLFPLPDSGWTPEVLTYSGYYNLGIEEVWDMVSRYVNFVRKNGYFTRKRSEQAKYRMYETINEQLRDSFYNNSEIASLLVRLEDDLQQSRKSSYAAAKEALDKYNELKK
ncbi:methylmalonyl Co-A mutase-associated GTPase MeaB [Proteiniphilum sp. UBA1028]|jgi:LAO/AO transport system kinase|uniref:methylmalonyl Co-A mutase-associated GTPase MeaB n=1 Tax=Proteiniphilum sp. UBA1028 TaxID=1947251 RepID=UPI000E865D72|nr:methylmalonyl Co-A mutase-associated GTPase MeaB [Proteiniphilum sp. UBA1028]HBG57211.1 methylmalonyl Co-A mutase-associated GTPase MeaB [Porphyromonadaceae bacterium]